MAHEESQAVQTLFTSISGAVQLFTHAVPDNNRGLSHTVQEVEFPVHSVHGDTHDSHTSSFSNFPAGQESTHSVTLRTLPEMHELQVVSEPEQVSHGDVQAAHRLFESAYSPLGHSSKHSVPF